MLHRVEASIPPCLRLTSSFAPLIQVFGDALFLVRKYRLAASPSPGDDLLVATLKSEALVRIRFSGSGDQYRVSDIKRWFASSQTSGRYVRLRDVVAGPDSSFYVLTSNRTGRGRAKSRDDRILLVAQTRCQLVPNLGRACASMVLGKMCRPMEMLIPRISCSAPIRG